MGKLHERENLVSILCIPQPVYAGEPVSIKEAQETGLLGMMPKLESTPIWDLR